MRNPITLAATATFSLIAVSTGAQAQVTSDPPPDLSAEVRELRARDAQSQRRIADLEQRLVALEAAAGLTGTGRPLSALEDATIRGRGAGLTKPFQVYSFGDQLVALQDGARQGGGGGDPAAPTQDGDEPQRRAPAPTESVETVTRDEQGYFGDKLSFEVGLNYSHFDDAAINLSGFLALDAIFLGLIRIDEITSDVLAADFTARYGLTDRLQIDANVPYLYRHSNFQSAGAGGDASGLAEKSVTDSGLGDVNFGVSYRLLKETAARPDVVINARAKAPTGRNPFGVELVEVPGTEGNLEVPTSLSTGTGVWGASVGVSVLKTIDPMVVFGSLSYFHNFPRSFGDIDEAEGDQPGRVWIGDAFQYGAGVAYALNERSSLSMSFTQRFVERTRIRREGQPFQRVVGSQANVGIVNLGASFALNDRLSLLTTVGIGMTSDAPDMVVSVRLPFRF